MFNKPGIIFTALCSAAAVAALLSSCAVDSLLEQHNGIEIAFRPVMASKSASRSADVTVADFKDRDLVVTAVDAHGDYYFKDVVFRNDDPSSSTPIYTSTEKYYWPGDGSPLYFTAYPADYVTRGLLDPTTGTLSYEPMSSWYTNEIRTFDGGTILPDGTTIAADKTVRLPAGETIAPDGTIRFHGNTTLHPDGTVTIVDWEGNAITMDTHRNITLPDGSVIDRFGTTTLTCGVKLLRDGRVMLADSTTVLTRSDVGTHDNITINDDGSITLPGNGYIPPVDMDWGVALPGDVYVESTGSVNLFFDAYIGTNGDIDYTGGDGLYGYNNVWLSTTTDIYLHGDIYLESGMTINADREVDWLTDRAALHPHEDIVLGHATGTNADIAGLPLTFNHALSSVEVWAKNTNPNYQYEIASVKLARIKGAGTRSIENGVAWNVDETVITDYAPDIDFNIKYYEVNPDNGSHTHKSFGLDYDHNSTACLSDPNLYMSTQVVGAPMGKLYGSLMVLPQTLTPWDKTAADKEGAYLAVKLNICTPLGGRVYPVTDFWKFEKKYAWVAVPLSGTWEPGKRYVYTLDFTDGAGYSDPEKPNPQPVLGNRMKFTVTVSDWTTGTHIEYPVTP